MLREGAYPQHLSKISDPKEKGFKKILLTGDKNKRLTMEYELATAQVGSNYSSSGSKCFVYI